MRSPKEYALDNKIIQMLESLNSHKNDLQTTEPAVNDKALTQSPALNLTKAVLAAKLILADDEIQAAQEYANTVSIIRLGYNDHGPVHMRTVVLNAINMASLLRKAGIKTNLEKEECGTFEDSLIAMMFAAMLHDLGMGVGRQDHELHSGFMSYPILERLLPRIYAGRITTLTIVRALAMEGITGHMGNKKIHSLEAGIVQVADGCDMTKGRARIPIALTEAPRAGQIHQYSANSIEEVKIDAGQEKPIRIDISMSSEVGIFQIEEVLLTKIASSTAKPYIELYAQVKNEASKRYL